ncbi:MAG: PAS domain S-box protein [Acidobacteria bacterium]|nr:PAS domain S-box protein [Acidobacteriota bacterium]
MPQPLRKEGRDAERRLRQFEMVFDLTTQMLATPKVEERLLLALETATTGLGYPQAAIALIDERASTLQMRAAVGFEDDEIVERLAMPLDSGAPHVAIIYEGRPVWLAREGDEATAAFLAELGCRHDLLALPLFGGQRLSKTLNRNLASSPRMADRHWGPEPVTCLGVLYIGAERAALDDDALEFLTRLADRIGQTVSSAMHYERLTELISKLQRERQWVESIMKSVADPIVLTNLDNEILLQNRRAEELFSGSKNANEGKRRALEMNDLLFSAYLSSAAFSTNDFVQRDITLVDPMEGSDLHHEVISTPAFNARGERIGLVSIFRDVTDLRNANEELAQNILKLQQAEMEARRERDRLDLIIENVGQPVAVCDQRGNFILFNARAELLFQTLAADAPSSVTAAVRTNSVKLTSFISTLASDAHTNVRRAEIELVKPGTGEKLPMEITAVEVEDAKGEVTAVVSILHDLSEMRELERRRVEQQLFESEKLAAVGRLAASIAHEVNNPLEAIKNSLYLLQTSRSEETNARFLEVARKETERVSHIIRQMLGFARRAGEVEWVNVNQVLEETMILIEKKLKQSGVRVERSLHPQLPAVRARADQLRQVFLNLILNAQQSIEGAGAIRINTMSEEQALQPSIAIEISDTGIGISEEELPRIFEPFFSKRQKGTGLGLWVTQDIVRQHGGRIEVTSTQGFGTTFRIILLVDSPTLGA